jgi:hypothetical protein
MLIVAVLLLVCVLVARADASPGDDRDGGDWAEDARADRGEYDASEPVVRVGRGGRGRLYVPITNEMIERVVTLAPPISRVLDAAYRAAGLAGDPTPGWRTRSRLSALVPYVSTRAGQHQAWREVSDPTISRGVGVDIRASWRLDKLVFDPNETRFATLDVARRRDRRRLAAYVIHLYFDWVASRAATLRDARAGLDVAEKTAELDALTAGWFSQAVAKGAELR